jgi:hypothetical protein
VRWLRGRVHNELGPLILKQLPYSLPVANVDGRMSVRCVLFLKSGYDRSRAACRTEKPVPHVIVNSNDIPSFLA